MAKLQMRLIFIEFEGLEEVTEFIIMLVKWVLVRGYITICIVILIIGILKKISYFAIAEMF